MYIIGISAFYHDSSACLIKDGEIIAAVQEERFTRIKHDAAFPSNAINFCIKEGNISLDEIKYVVFYDKPLLKFERLLETTLAFLPRGVKTFITALPVWIKDKLFQRTNIIRELNKLFPESIKWEEKLLFSEHHLSHAASAFYPSPFTEAAILTIDGVGEWVTTSVSIGKDHKIQILKEIQFPHSLGLLYSAFTYFIGFKVNSGEYKLMGLAPYGKPVYSQVIKNNLIAIQEDGSFNLNMKFFNYCTGLTMTNKRFDKLFDGPPRKPESQITQREMDLAASIQEVTEEIIVKIARNIAATTGQKNLCIAGGVGLNCVANGKLLDEKIFDNIWIQPAAGDAGGAIGAALSVHHFLVKQNPISHKKEDGMKGAFLGPCYTDAEINEQLLATGAKFSTYEQNEMIRITAQELANGKAVGWMNGKMEFGPRALGCRSILADPRGEDVQKKLNLKIKFRESFRPFAPSILREDLEEWFELDIDSPYMLLVAEIKKSKRLNIPGEQNSIVGFDKINTPRSLVPAITHIDYSARIQTVTEKTNPVYYKLLKEFKKNTGCPILVNTSFNVRGEPIVCSPLDAFKCFMGTEIDVLVVGNAILYKSEQSMELKDKYFHKYELD